MNLDPFALANATTIQLVLVFQLLFAFGLGFLISWIYKKTHRGFSYSQSFSITLVLLTVISTLIFVFINDNVAVAIGIFGAFSIIRFRTAVKDPRDTAFVFWCLAIGLGVGVKLFLPALTGMLVIGGIVLLLSNINFGGISKLNHVLSFTLKGDSNEDAKYKELFRKHLSKYELINVKSKQDGELLDFTFHINLKRTADLADFVSDLKNIKGVAKVNVFSSKNNLEY